MSELINISTEVRGVEVNLRVNMTGQSVEFDGLFGRNDWWADVQVVYQRE